MNPDPAKPDEAKIKQSVEAAHEAAKDALKHL